MITTFNTAAIASIFLPAIPGGRWVVDGWSYSFSNAPTSGASLIIVAGCTVSGGTAATIPGIVTPGIVTNGTQVGGRLILGFDTRSSGPVYFPEKRIGNLNESLGFFLAGTTASVINRLNLHQIFESL
jgi:hypothetical protein